LELPRDLAPLADDRASQKTVRALPPIEKNPVDAIAAKTRALNDAIDSLHAVDLCLPEPEQYKVLLQNLPAQMLQERMLRVMLEQAKLTDVMGVDVANRKALITFASYASVGQCIAHFHGRKWGCATMPVTATCGCTKQQPAAKPMSANAPTFVPGSWQSMAKNSPAHAQDCVSASYKIGQRSRLSTSASTDVGSGSDRASDGGDSETGAPVACT